MKKADPKLSKTAKMSGVLSWSLQAGTTCPGSVDNGQLVPACAGCYAMSGNYRYPAVKAVREHNLSDWKASDWVSVMVDRLQGEKYFRWLDSGDLYALALAEKVYAVMAGTPGTKHWLPTRMEKFPKFSPILERMRTLPNVAVRFSSDSITGEYTKGVHGSVIIPTPEHKRRGMTVCRAYAQDGMCLDCRACYNPAIPVIAYIAHGLTMKKNIRLLGFTV